MLIKKEARCVECGAEIDCRRDKFYAAVFVVGEAIVSCALCAECRRKIPAAIASAQPAPACLKEFPLIDGQTGIHLHPGIASETAYVFDVDLAKQFVRIEMPEAQKYLPLLINGHLA